MITLAHVAVAALLIVALAARAADPQACIASAGGAGAGTVESVRAVPIESDLDAFAPQILEHRLRPETGEELVVRLDEGPLVVLTVRKPQHLHAGERVYISGHCALPFGESPELASRAQRGF